MTDLLGRIASDVVIGGHTLYLDAGQYFASGGIFIKALRERDGVLFHYVTINLRRLGYNEIAVNTPESSEFFGILLGTGLFEATGELKEVRNQVYPILRLIEGAEVKVEAASMWTDVPPPIDPWYFDELGNY